MEKKALFELTSLTSYLSTDRVLNVMRASVVLLLALAAIPLCKRAVQHFFGERLQAAQLALVQRFVSYGVIALGATSTLRELGFEISVLLGAAGVVTVAVGFAAQTSVSNIISGLFLLTERAFTLGDTIAVDAVTGEVLSIDLLSVKLRTSDNVYVRLPNETLLKSTVNNLTRYAQRSVTVDFAVSVGENVDAVRDLVLRTAAEQEGVLPQPKPAFVLVGYDDAALRMQVVVWSERVALTQTKNAVLAALHGGFAQAGIRLPTPPRSVQVTQGPASS